ncbi:hypothetical protein BJ170DRAFT_603881 [Xylariales sp. AK1849]|nr:hypothetical protein BJ170DRAFT_603881 [Xylariales sp. AK1849]
MTCGPGGKDPFLTTSSPSPPKTASDGDFFTMGQTLTPSVKSSATYFSPATATVTSSAGTTRSYTMTTGPALIASETTLAVSSTSSRLDTGAKVALGVCTAIAALAVSLALMIICRRKRNPRWYLRETSPTNHIRTYSQTPSGSHTSLIRPAPFSSSKTTPLTPPPLRLSDRRLLSSILRPDSLRSSLASPPSELTFPQHPIFAPTISRLLPRHEHHATISSTKSDLDHSFLTSLPSIARSSLSSIDSGQGTVSSVTAASDKTGSVKPGSITITGSGTPPISLSRPPQPYDPPLEISSLVTPAGPPPDQALPRAPPQSYPGSPPVPKFPVVPVPPLSPTSASWLLPPTSHPISPPSQHGGICVAGGVVRDNPAAGVILPRSSRNLCEPTEAYARERQGTRESWGSWSGAGGGGSGFNATGRRKGDGGPRSSGGKKGVGGAAMGLQHLDLEKLGGSYYGIE